MMMHISGKIKEDMLEGTWNVKGWDLLTDLDVSEKIILKYILRKHFSADVLWIELSPGRVQCCALLSTVMNLAVTSKAWDFLSSWTNSSFCWINLLNIYTSNKSIYFLHL
jgi:hypothetical protein